MASPKFDLAVSEKSQAACLYPTTPTFSKRYETKKSRSAPENVLIQPGLFCYARESQPRYLPEGWSPHVQPEGQIYFACETGPVRVVTDAYMYTPSVWEKILYFTAVVAKILEAKSITLPDSAELYLSLRDDENGCDYYIADHASHALSWLEPVNTDDLNIVSVISESHLRYALEDLYWVHVEYFPSHRIHALHLALDELIPIFIHGEADQRTSQGSTFPYDAQQCKHFVRILHQVRENVARPPSVCLVARLWSNIARHREQIHYAQERARLDRTQNILDSPESQRSMLFSAASRALLGVPSVYIKQLERTWVDQLVYVHIWRDFLTSAQNEWRQHLTWSLGMSIVNLLFFLVPGASCPIAGMSLACCAGAALSALALLTRHQTTCVRSCDDATAFLPDSSEDDHQSVALTFALPRALFLWAALLAAAQGLVWLERATNAYVLAALAVLVVLASLPWRRCGERIASAVPCWRRSASESESEAYDAAEIA